MRNFEPVQGLVSEEVFDTFITSKWPGLFGGTAHHSLTNDVDLGKCVEALEATVALSPMEERDMLADMGIIEQEPRPEYLDEPRDFRFTTAGHQLVSLCEGLYTPEEHEAREAEAKVRIEESKAEHEEWLSQQ